MMPPENAHQTPSLEKGAYQHFLATREEILKYKWVASEEAGYDIGFEAGLLGWRAHQKKTSTEKSTGRKNT